MWASPVALAQPSMVGAPHTTMDMAIAVRAAVKTHPSVRGAGQQVKQAEESVAAARAGYKPQITGGLETQSSSYRTGTYDSRNVFTAKITGSQMLYDFGKVAGAKHVAEASVRGSEAGVDLATDQVAMNTAQAWVNAHLQQEMLQIARDQLAAIESIARLVEERAAKGATTRSDVEQARTRINAARSQLLGIEADAHSASLALMYLTGQTQPVSISGGMPVVLHDAACRLEMGSDIPAVRVASAGRDEADAEVDIARAQRLPTLSLDGNIGQALTHGSRMYGEYATTGQVGFNVSMPLYQGGAAKARERSAHYQLRAAEDAVDQARLEMQQGFSDAKAQAEGWANRGPVLGARVESIDATRKLYHQQYLQLGTRTLIELLNAEQEYSNARVDQVQGIHAQYQLGVQCLYFSDRMRSTFRLDAQPFTTEAEIAQRGNQ